MKLLSITWFLVLSLSLFFLSLDAYFYPTFVQKRIFLPPEMLFFGSLMLSYVLLLSLIMRGIIGGGISKKTRLIILGGVVGFYFLWLFLEQFLSHLNNLILLTKDTESIYTRFYHLHFSQIRKIQELLRLYFTPAILFVLLLPPWSKIYARLFWIITNFRFPWKKSQLARVIKDWILIFPAIFIILFVASIIASRMNSPLSQIVTNASSLSIIILAITIVLVVALRLNPTRGNEKILFNLLMSFSILILAAVQFGSLGLYSRIILSLMTIIIIFILLN